MNAMPPPAARPLAGRLALATLLSVALHGSAAVWLSAFPQGSSAPERNAPALKLVSLARGESAGRGKAISPPGVENGVPDLRGRAARYFSASELDSRPIALLPVDPQYPDPAPKHASLIVLAVLINETGTVDRVVPLTDSPGDPLRESAAAAFSRARFAPGLRNGTPVKSRMLVEVKFEGANDDARPGPSASK